MIFLISITLFSSTVFALPPPFTGRTPYYHVTYAGDEDGDTSCFSSSNDGKIIKWVGEWGYFGRLGLLFLWGYCIKFSTYFDDPGSSYDDNSVTIRYKFTGGGKFGMQIYFVGTGGMYIELPSTGSSFSSKTYSIGDSRVYGIAFGAVHLYGQVYVEVDYLAALYSY
ncbi:MAG: hypothetical protein ACFE9S_13295 [Candidatus Hermodarchaeota archaeon]